jgi:cysteine desulfurase/selenocysteine lyase
MPNHLYVETLETGNVKLYGDIQQILGNRRAYRLLKDNSVFTVQEESIVFEQTEELNKTLDRISRIAKLAGCELSYTKNVSDALNKICLMLENNLNESDEVITSELEHHSSVLPWMKACERRNATLKYIPLNHEGRITVDNFKKVLTSKTKIVALTLVSNVMGYLTPIKEIIDLAHEVGAVVIVDAAQAIQHFSIDVKQLNCDFLAFSGHKAMGPTGIGVLYGKKKLLKTLQPIDFGGDMNEEVDLFNVEIKDIPYRFETGTPPIAEAIGLGKALEFINELGLENIHKQEKELHKYAIEKLEKIEGITIYNKTSDVGIISFNIDGVHPHDAATFFDEANICLRAGHHCAQLITKWLKCVGTLRASLYIYNNYEDIDRFVEVVKQTVDFFKQF